MQFLVPPDLPGRPEPAPGRLAAGRQRGRVRPDGGHLGAGDVLGHPDGPGGGHRSPALRGPPGPQVRGEDGVVVLAGRSDRAGREGGQHRVVHPQPVAERLPQGGLPALGEAAHPGRHVHRHRTGGRRDPGRLGDGGAAPHHQPPAPGAQRGVEVGQAAGQEGGPVGHREAGGGHRVVQDEQRHHLVGVGEGGPEHGVVVQPQVLGEERDGDGHTPMATAAGPAARPDTPGEHRSAGGRLRGTPKGRTPRRESGPDSDLVCLPDQASPPAEPGSAEATSSSW